MPKMPMGMHIPERKGLGGDNRKITKGNIPKSTGIKLMITKRRLLIGS